jgi:hypothetical protein
MASTSLSTSITGICFVDLTIHESNYPNVRLHVMDNLCADIILGIDFQSQHQSVTLKFDGVRDPLVVGLATLNVEPINLFENLTPDCKPIASKSRHYSAEDRNFISSEVQRLYKEGIIEPSTSPWRSQVVVTRNERSKKRLVIDYSQTINRFTCLDAYPLPRVDELVNKISQYRYFSTIDLKSVYHQVPIKQEDRLYTAFEADGGLHQFTRMPFGVTNGVAQFQRTMDIFIVKEKLKDTFAYLDNLTICGMTQGEHDYNLKRFFLAAKTKN